MPKLAKSTKAARDTGVIRGIRQHFATGKDIIIHQVRYTADSLAALFEEHLRAMARVDALTIERGLAVAEERRLEAELAPVYAGVKAAAESLLGIRSPRLRELGIEPDKKPRMTAETKKRANEKRQATRKRRGIMGKRQRAKLKRGR